MQQFALATETDTGVIADSPFEGTSHSDIQAMLRIARMLQSNYQQEFPSISALARKALMSESKFKKLFKKVLGTGPFEYYQRNRMQIARDLILEGRYTISQIGNMLGYQNLSNFSYSFKKEHAVLPSNIMRGNRSLMS